MTNDDRSTCGQVLRKIYFMFTLPARKYSALQQLIALTALGIADNRLNSTLNLLSGKFIQDIPLALKSATPNSLKMYGTFNTANLISKFNS